MVNRNKTPESDRQKIVSYLRHLAVVRFKLFRETKNPHYNSAATALEFAADSIEDEVDVTSSW